MSHREYNVENPTFAFDDDPLPVASDEETYEEVEDDELLQIEKQEKLDELMRTFRDPVYEKMYRDLLDDDDELMSLNEVIAMSKIRFRHAVRQNKSGMEVSSLLRSITDAIDRAITIRERHNEYIHFEQLLWMLHKVYEIVEAEVSDQDDLTKISQRLSMLQLPRRDQISVEIKAQARALSEGRRTHED